MRQNAQKCRQSSIKKFIKPLKSWQLSPISSVLTVRSYNDFYQKLRWFTLVTLMGMGGQTAQAATLTDINGLVSQAITTHPLVGAARAEEQATAEGITAAKLGLYPQPSISSSYDKNEGVISKVGLRQPLWTGGKLTASVNQAIYDDKAAMAYVLEQQNTVAKNTIDVWQSYIYAMSLQGLYINNLKQLDEFETMMKRRVDQGVSARIDLDLVTNRILQDQNAYQGAVQQQRIAAARLSQMIGETVSDNGVQAIPLNEMARYVKSQSSDFEKLAFSQASFNNPSVIKQQFQVEAAKQQVKAQQAAQYPTVYAQYEQLYYHRDDKSDGQFSLGLSYDPGAGFSNLALARASQARVQSLAQTQEAARRTVMEDIQTQYQQFVSAKDQETSLIAAVAGAQIVVDSYRRQFIAGRKSWLEVLNAVREKSGYQQQLLQVQSQMLAAFYKLQVEFGRMPWQNNNLLYQPVIEFHPYESFEDWLKKQPAKLNENMNTVHPIPATWQERFGLDKIGLDNIHLDKIGSLMPTMPTLFTPKKDDNSSDQSRENNLSNSDEVTQSLSQPSLSQPTTTNSQTAEINPSEPAVADKATANQVITDKVIVDEVASAKMTADITTNKSDETTLPLAVVPPTVNVQKTELSLASVLSMNETKNLGLPKPNLTSSVGNKKSDDLPSQTFEPTLETAHIDDAALQNKPILLVAAVDELPPLQRYK